VDDDRRVDAEGNNALHLLLLPLTEKRGGKWIRKITPDYFNTIQFIFTATITGCDINAKNNEGESPIYIVKERLLSRDLAIGRHDTEDIKTLKKMEELMDAYRNAELRASAAKAAAATTAVYWGSAYASSVLAGPYILNYPASWMVDYTIGYAFPSLSTSTWTGWGLSWVLTFGTLMYLLYLVKKALGCKGSGGDAAAAAV